MRIDLYTISRRVHATVQVDILSNDGEVQEVVKFVSDNAQRLLNVESARVMPISSRMALEAKLALQNGRLT